MLTIDKLKELGADTESGINRCVGNEDFYLKIVGMVLNSGDFDALKEAIDNGDLDTGFEKAHALKGIVSNASLDSLLAPVVEITEHLRAREDMDYAPLVDAIFSPLSNRVFIVLLNHLLYALSLKRALSYFYYTTFPPF